MVDSVSVRFKNARVEKGPLNIRIQWNAGTACVSECVLKALACQGLRVDPSKGVTPKPCFLCWLCVLRWVRAFPTLCESECFDQHISEVLSCGNGMGALLVPAG